MSKNKKRFFFDFGFFTMRKSDKKKLEIKLKKRKADSDNLSGTIAEIKAADKTIIRNGRIVSKKELVKGGNSAMRNYKEITDRETGTRFYKRRKFTKGG